MRAFKKLCSGIPGITAPDAQPYLRFNPRLRDAVHPLEAALGTGMNPEQVLGGRGSPQHTHVHALQTSEVPFLREFRKLPGFFERLAKKGLGTERQRGDWRLEGLPAAWERLPARHELLGSSPNPGVGPFQQPEYLPVCSFRNCVSFTKSAERR